MLGVLRAASYFLLKISGLRLAFGTRIVDDGSNPYWYYGLEPSVLRTVGDQPTLWEVVLPPEVLVMSPELAKVDALLDDVRLFEPFRGSAVDPDRDLSSVDVSDLQVPAGL